jgi:hypothetical protein
MEAVAKHDFNATAEDELSFRKNQILKVIPFGIYSKLINYKINLDSRLFLATTIKFYFGDFFFSIDLIFLFLIWIKINFWNNI